MGKIPWILDGTTIEYIKKCIKKKEIKTISQTLLRENLHSRPVAVNVVIAVSIAVS